MLPRRIVFWALALCALLTSAALGASLAGGGHILAATSRVLNQDPIRLIQVGDRKVSRTTVDNTRDLIGAIESSRPGDTIFMAPGVYDGFKLGKLAFDGTVTVTSADPNKPAVFTDFRLNGVQGLTFTNLEFHATQGSFSFEVKNGENVHFDRVHFHGSLDGDSSNDPSGLGFSGSKNISVTNSEFQQLARGLAISSSEGITVSGNKFHDLRLDGMNFAQVGDVRILNNAFRNFRPDADDHPDAIQFWTSGTTTPSHDIVISGNVIMRGEGAYIQGIFLRDQLGTLPYERVTISDNLIVGTGYNGIRVNGVKNLILSNNELVTFAGDNNTFLLIKKGAGIEATGNRATIISFEDSTDVVQRGNQISGAVHDMGEGAIRNWLQANPEAAAAASLLPVVVTPEVPVEFDPAILSGFHTTLFGAFDFA
jgi:pectate lyase